MKKIIILISIMLLVFLATAIGCKFNPDEVASMIVGNDEADDNSSDRENYTQRSQEEEEAVEEEEEKLNDDNDENIPPKIELIINEGPIYSDQDGVCYYRIKAVVEGYPEPEIIFSRDDSDGSFGKNIAQINIYSEDDEYELSATARNQEGESRDSILLEWGCEENKDVSFNNDFTLNDIDGKTVNLSDFQGNIIVLNFWATWCGPCRAEIPDFVEVYNEYKDNNVAFVGVSLDGDINELIQFVNEFNINYPTLFDDQNVNDVWKIEAIPTTFILDKNGNILEKRVGSMVKQDLINLIESNI